VVVVVVIGDGVKARFEQKRLIICSSIKDSTWIERADRHLYAYFED